MIFNRDEWAQTPGVLSCPEKKLSLKPKKMKKLSLGKLWLSSEEVLQRSQMKMVYGGGFWHCHCGISNPSLFTVMANNDMEAVATAAESCGAGAQCAEVVQ
jgi:natural product precursor